MVRPTERARDAPHGDQLRVSRRSLSLKAHSYTYMPWHNRRWLLRETESRSRVNAEFKGPRSSAASRAHKWPPDELLALTPFISRDCGSMFISQFTLHSFRHHPGRISHGLSLFMTEFNAQMVNRTWKIPICRNIVNKRYAPHFRAGLPCPFTS